jgi:hypothetical protein
MGRLVEHRAVARCLRGRPAAEFHYRHYDAGEAAITH